MNAKHIWLKRLPLIVGVLLSVLVAVLLYLLKDHFHKGPQMKRVVQQISVIPPPPPPPPPEIKPPEPEVVEPEKIEEPKPEPEPEPAPEASDEPPGEQLGVDGAGTAGSDGFGLAARQGGRSLLGGARGSAVLWYGGQVKQRLDEVLYPLLEDTQARQNPYRVELAVWVEPDGRVSRVELVQGSGMETVDQAIRNALPRVHIQLSRTPPEQTPQPIRIRLDSRMGS
ncbi:MAG: TonB family protein [Methylococcaceae bacterium]